VTILALSRYLSFHARGDAVFAWHGLTGDVAEMSRDVLALLLSFDPPRDEEQPGPASLPPEQAREFVGILRARRYLVQTAADRRPDEMSPLLAGFPRVPRNTVFERDGDQVTLYTRARKAVALDPTTARLFLRCDGERSLGQVLGDAGPGALNDLLRLARAANALKGDADYDRYAYAALMKGYPGEAKTVLDEGIKAGVVDPNKSPFKEEIAQAKTKSAGEEASLESSAKSALAGGTAKAALATGDLHYTYGQYAKAVELYRAALKKSGADANLINLHLGMALARSGDKAGATAALNAVTGPRADIAKYWLAYVSTLS